MIDWLFSGDYTPRRDCGDWPTWLVVQFISADLRITISYFVIPVFLLFVYYRKRDVLPHPRMLVLFAAFITSCGLTHAADAFMFYYPYYRISAIILEITAWLSVVTAVTLPFFVRHVCALRTPAEYQILLDEKDLVLAAQIRAEKELRSQKEATDRRCEKAIALMESKLWGASMRVNLEEIKKLLKEIKGA